ncbi:MAG: class I SAM-dependent methyltransferase [Burkholderiales bacterium]
MHMPKPRAEKLARSRTLSDLLRAEIERDGWMSFARYMELALYAPGLGYYNAQDFERDFVTAPELSPLFARALARQVAQVLDEFGGDLLEFGAGSGRLALDLMLELESVRKLPSRYCIIEVSSALAARQKELIERAAPALGSRFEWLSSLPARFTGLILANEVLDAMPVHLVAWRRDGIFEREVALDCGRFIWREKPLVQSTLFEAASQLKIEGDYVSEISLAVRHFVSILGGILERGALLFSDYGFGVSEYYHPQRSTGTLMCHYRNHSHADPFYLPGLQDITSHVDFSAVARAGASSGLELLGYTSQANFLINCGITELLAATPAENAAQYLPLAAGVQKLLSPSEMGELFKVIALGRNVDAPLIGFGQGDKSRLL